MSTESRSTAAAEPTAADQPAEAMIAGAMSLEQVKDAVRLLRDAVERRAGEERSIEGEHRAAITAEETAYAEAVQAAESAFRGEEERIERDHSVRAAEIERRFAADHRRVEHAYRTARDQVRARYESDLAACRQRYQDARWMVQSVYDESAEDNPKQRFESYKAQRAATRERIDQAWAELQQHQQRAEALGQQLYLPRGQAVGSSEAIPREPLEVLECFDEASGRARDWLRRLERDGLSRVFAGWRPLWWFAVVTATVAAGAFWGLSPAMLGLALAPADWRWPALCLAGGAAAFLLFVGPLWMVARRRAGRMQQRFLEEFQRAGQARQRWRLATQEEYERLANDYRRWHGRMLRERDAALKKAEKAYRQKAAELQRRLDAELAAIEERFPPELEELERLRERLQRENDADRARRLEQLRRTHRQTMEQLAAEHRRRMAEFEASRAARWHAMERRWHDALARVAQISDELSQTVCRLFPPWDSTDAGSWPLAERLPAAVPFGWFDVRLDRWPQGLPDDERLLPGRCEFPLPAVIELSERPSLVIHTGERGRDAAVAILQNTMLRLLLGLPPGKVRFTVIDPVGLGQNFATFMHLADFDERLVTSRIWTEPAHIEQRLADLTEHMETVFQKYLRNEFANIQEYNACAGEVADPYRVLVVCGFPAGFSDPAARRLLSIIGSGPRCGVLSLLAVDDRSKLPPNVDVADLHQHAVVLRWKDDRFVCEEPELASLPLVPETPPDPETFGALVKEAGRRSRDVRRVEVPFERVAPPDEQLWSRDSRSGIDVPLGRAGAMQLQRLRLGEGTLQHVLVAGKTGSGKSSFLHVLITNLALYYGPDEIEFYLIDFKKGVEFKTYATHRLPHARVIAIESDREFGVSVLERLDAELKERGDVFRACGVQDIEQFRNRRPHVRMPRILLIIDEFQEFFVEDDRYSQSAALLLDRLVRQGRAFGIHVLLGSQTLGGAYSLARTTLGQMAVRIALQCSEADAHLILSEENTAARLLSRPGEAIYNDASGLREGNQPFQIAWLPEQTRERQLQRIRRLSEIRGVHRPPPIVFEGNVPADPKANAEYVAALRERPSGASGAAVYRAWIGDAVAITGPVAVRLRPQAGGNVLVVGRAEDSALGVLTNAVLSLAAHLPVHPGQEPQGTPPKSLAAPDDAAGRGLPPIVVLDGSRAEEVVRGVWSRLAARLEPCCLHVGPGADAERIIDGLLAEVEAREGGSGEATPRFLVVYGLGRFRELRKDEDDFGFGFDRDRPASPGKRFAQLLRRGPLVGVHTLLWCDSYNNLTRWLVRDALREFETRIVFSMSANDSSNLIESPVAARLGPHRAYLYEEATGTLCKFRPYAGGTEEWFRWIDAVAGPQWRPGSRGEAPREPSWDAGAAHTGDERTAM